LLLPPKYVGAEQGGIDARQVQELLPEEHRAFVDELLVRYGIGPATEQPRATEADSTSRPRVMSPCSRWLSPTTSG